MVAALCCLEARMTDIKTDSNYTKQLELFTVIMLLNLL